MNNRILGKLHDNSYKDIGKQDNYKKHQTISSILGLDSKSVRNTLSILLGFMFVMAFVVSFIIIRNHSLNHSYFMHNQSNVDQTTFAARNYIFSDDDEDSFNVTIMYNEEMMSFSTQDLTVRDLFDDIGWDMSNKVTDIDYDSMIEDDIFITVYDVTYHDIVEETSIPYETVMEEVTNIPYNTTKVTVKGVNGYTRKVTRQKIVNDKVVEETVIEDSAADPVNEVVCIGKGGYFTGPDGVTYHYSHYYDMQATAYTAPYGAVTATGDYVDTSMIAVDRTLIPLGTKVYVASEYGDFGVKYAKDVGGAIRGNIIDIFMGYDYEAEEKALEWGRKYVRVYILLDD